MTKFFATQKVWRKWLAGHHDTERELVVGYYKTSSKRRSITWDQSVDEALCFGWIDGVRKSIDETSYQIRFTPRKPSSTWSRKNIARMKELIDEGLVHAAGLAAFERRRDDSSAVYAYEQRMGAKLPPALQKKLEANRKAFAFFSNQAPSYQKTATYWVVSAKKEETRARRLKQLIVDSAAGRRIAQLTPRKAT